MNQIFRHTLSIGERTFTYILERKSVKNINLRIRRDQTICVSAHPGVPLGQIEKFLQKQEAFIVKTLADYAAQPPFLTLRDGDTLFLAGKACKLDVRLGLRNSVRRRGDSVLMEVAEKTPELRRRLYHELLRREGEVLFAASCRRVFPLLAPYGLEMPKLRQRVMRSRWGSCMPLKGIITMNTYLAVMPEAIIDHVMLHELCHLIHPNHSRHFYNVMTMVMPDWKERRAAMVTYLPYCV